MVKGRPFIKSALSIEIASDPPILPSSQNTGANFYKGASQGHIPHATFLMTSLTYQSLAKTTSAVIGTQCLAFLPTKIDSAGLKTLTMSDRFTILVKQYLQGVLLTGSAQKSSKYGAGEK